jgi:hypothetical protein
LLLNILPKTDIKNWMSLIFEAMWNLPWYSTPANWEHRLSLKIKLIVGETFCVILSSVAVLAGTRKHNEDITNL